MAITGDDLRRICGAWIMLSEQAERDERQRILEIIAEAERTGDIDMVTAEMLVSRITVTPPGARVGRSDMTPEERAPDALLPGLRAARDVGRPIFQSCHRLANWMPEGRLRDEMLAIARAVEGLEKAPTAAAERARWLACRRMVNGEPHGWSITRLNEVADGAEGERA